jgi:hypothetical protein
MVVVATESHDVCAVDEATGRVYWQANIGQAGPGGAVAVWPHLADGRYHADAD